MVNIKSTLTRYMRVLQISRKPSKDEFTTSSKVPALGIAAIGTIGFVIFLLFVLLMPA